MNDTYVAILENVSKSFDGIEVLNNCNMKVKRGCIYGFLGANGAGKTTVFKILSGLLSTSMGKVKVLGQEISSVSNKALDNIGLIIETPIFYEHLSATENMEIHLSYMQREGVNIASTLEKVGLCNTGTLPVSKFSLGMRQRLAIARAIIHKPKLLILDEPVNGLDPLGIKEIRELFIELVEKQEMTILLSSHMLAEIEQIADDIGVIVNGTIIQEGSLQDIKKKHTGSLEDYIIKIISGGKVNASFD